MAGRAEIPRYLIEAVIRHYTTLAQAYRYDGNLRAANAARVCRSECKRLQRLIKEQNRKG